MMPQQAVAGEAAIAQINAQMQLRALHERREMISDQYQNVMAERGHVGQERMNAQARGDAGMVKEYDGVLERVGRRLQELERTLASVDKQIDEAMKAPVLAADVAPGAGQPISITVPPPFEPDMVSLYTSQGEALRAQRDEYQRMMIAEGAVLLMLGALLWRFGVARGHRKAMRMQAPRDDAKLQQAVDAIAIEVERLSEGQRFINNVLAAKRPEREALPVQQRPEPRDPAWNTPH
jgi:hypothetical protein